MKYPYVKFDSKEFTEDPPDGAEEAQWFAGESLAKFIAKNLEIKDDISIDIDNDVLLEDWGWCVVLRSKGMRFFLGIHEDFDEDNDWHVFINKDFDIIAKLFKKAKLQTSVQYLKDEINSILSSTDSVSDIKWTME